ncbi:Putative metal-binding motif-containing protein [Stigmatella aurantiaca]|uniref:Putative metal-binding motif-containing protein n=1 Tax=Stigmatella aurantiaca TaxID=41 RepID=A0A1H7LZ66_STIAU|nr:putative metal-binding motif-containing protein [Stigmatella aurantiaca]SEL04266.1 Putative metal-binding motif-containing protein [Stigmatella aurantiaca]
MRGLSVWVALSGLLLSCTVPSLEEVISGKPLSCDAEHSCGEGRACAQGTCVDAPCEGPLIAVGYRGDLDGDGYAPSGAPYEIFCDGLPAGFVGQTGDCDDANAGRHPGALEVCDGQDNDCNGDTDDGVGASWYPDQDGDGFGDVNAASLIRCTQPSGYVQDHSDCLDSNAKVYPRKDFTETTCDEVDDDCDGVADDGFSMKGTTCADPCLGGTWVCAADKTGLVCAGAPPRESYYPDSDGDGAGDGSNGASGSKCPNENLPTGVVFNMDDCDDQDPYNRRGKTEVCDGRDNDCNSLADEKNVCMGKGWKPITTGLPANAFWNTVALGPNGRVWVAGVGATLAVRLQTGQSFTSVGCGNVNWNAAWVSPSSGNVSLGGEGGKFALHSGSSCMSERTLYSSSVAAVTGRMESDTLRLYAVNVFGMLYALVPAQDQVNQLFDKDPGAFFGIHALDDTSLLLVGSTNEFAVASAYPYIASHPGTGGQDKLKEHTLTGIPSDYRGALRAVWMVSPRLAYAVGDKGLVLKWDGQQTWARIAPPSYSADADYTSVTVLDPYSVYITDTEGRVLLLKPGGWALTPLYDGPHPLRDIAVNAADDIWAVGDNGLVIHFAE